jgi:hypothetical protein
MTPLPVPLPFDENPRRPHGIKIAHDPAFVIANSGRRFLDFFDQFGEVHRNPRGR